ncbi:MAG: HAD hydrolase-like protein [Thomasclavelia sp.]|nr:HAD hydrolase-like protein [Thomasclavelia sp.]
MFYRQNLNDIKLVILSLDGGLLDLNHFRFNYYNRICKSYGKSITREEFVSHLGNYQTMYDNSPIKEEMNNLKLNHVIERDLYEYAKLKQNFKKPGVEELLQFFKQKNIKIAIVSTNKTKRAMQYLQLSGIYKYADFIIGGDAKLPPIPDPSVLTTISEAFQVKPENTLVIANFYNMVLAANKALMNIIFVEDMQEPNQKIMDSVFKCAKNNLEVINVILFSKYDTADMFSPILGMSSSMSEDQLNSVYLNLKERYADDPQLLEVVDNTYKSFTKQYEVKDDSEDVVHNLPTDNTLFEETDEKLSTSNDIDEGESKAPESPEESSLEIDTANEEDIPENKEEIIEEDNLEPTPILEETEPEESNQDILLGTNEESHEDNKFNPDATSFNEKANLFEKNDDVDLTVTSALSADAMRVNELMSVINGTSTDSESTKEIESDNQEKDVKTNDKEEKKDFSFDEIDQNEDKEKDNAFLSFIYVLLINLVIIIIAMMAYVPLEDFINSSNLFSEIIKGILDFYISVVRNLIQIIFNTLNNIIGAIPNYKSLMNGNGAFSGTAIEVIFFVLFNTLIYYICKGIYYLVSEEVPNDNSNIEEEEKAD